MNLVSPAQYTHTLTHSHSLLQVRRMRLGLYGLDGKINYFAPQKIHHKYPERDTQKNCVNRKIITKSSQVLMNRNMKVGVMKIVLKAFFNYEYTNA